MPEITFKTEFPYWGQIPKPVPASKALPEWYKNIGPNIGPSTVLEDNLYDKGATIKTCVPVRDLLMSGYIIPLWEELFTEQHSPDSERVFAFATSSDQKMQGLYGSQVSRHGASQFKGSPMDKAVRGTRAPKISCPWNFYTPSGYSTLFIAPQYRENKIEILPAIVDTDVWHSVQFPFLYKGIKKKDIIKVDTPVIQVIPFKRESWTSNLELETEPKGRQLYGIWTKIQHGYKKNFSKKKSFR
jgi:hypothetical protein|tara:strand:+ start:242 stop:970 length:729 start_codon:yes stop_codon:yes gene_type:complete